ncbi:MAG: site-specific integrase, partial [Shewanella sp.]
MSTQTGEMSVLDAQWLHTFERYLTTERQLSAHTVRNYLYELNRVSALLPEGVHLLTVNREHGQQVLAKLHRQGLSPRSLSLCLSALKQWGEFL